MNNQKISNIKRKIKIQELIIVTIILFVASISVIYKLINNDIQNDYFNNLLILLAIFINFGLDPLLKAIYIHKYRNSIDVEKLKLSKPMKKIKTLSFSIGLTVFIICILIITTMSLVSFNNIIFATLISFLLTLIIDSFLQLQYLNIKSD